MKTTAPNTAFLGAGNMTSALLRGAIQSGLAPQTFGASDVNAAAVAKLSSELGVKAFSDNASAAAWGDVIVLAVKPQVLPAVLAQIAPQLKSQTLVISIAAGIPIARISAGLNGHRRIVRAMPNTPALVGAGATALAGDASVSAEEWETALALFRGTGLVVQVDEKLIDGVTALSGSGPAYVFVAIEALSDAGVREGLPRDIATRLAAQTLLGAAKMVLETGSHPGALKDAVTSPAGTTIAGLTALERGGFRAALQAAVEAAAKRAKELAGG
ncbi:MAG TPA: pyrroline-5-carboxylate reductase [Polyangiales bacterium]